MEIYLTRIRDELGVTQPHAQHAVLPAYAHDGDAGMDLRAAVAAVIPPGETRLIPTGWAIQLPEGYEAQVRPRSGLALKHSITVLNAPGTIDSGYRGEIGVVLINHGKQDFVVETGERIAQMVIARYERVTVCEAEYIDSDTQRGTGGYGSSGRR